MKLNKTQIQLKDFALDTNISDSDMIIGDDSQEFRHTKNYSVSGLAVFVRGGKGEAGQVLTNNGDGTWSFQGPVSTTTTTTTIAGTTTTTTTAAPTTTTTTTLSGTTTTTTTAAPTTTTTTTSATTTTTTTAAPTTTTTTTSAPTTTTTTSTTTTTTTTAPPTTTTTTTQAYTFPSSAGTWYHNGGFFSGQVQGHISISNGCNDLLSNGKVAFVIKDSQNNWLNSITDIDASISLGNTITAYTSATGNSYTTVGVVYSNRYFGVSSSNSATSPEYVFDLGGGTLTEITSGEYYHECT